MKTVVVSFANLKGGVGKSKLGQVFLNWLFSAKGEKGVLVDADPQRTNFNLRQMDLVRYSEEFASGAMNEDEIYEITPMKASDFPKRLLEFKDFGVVVLDMAGTLEEKGVREAYSLVDVMVVPTGASVEDINSTQLFFNSFVDNVIDKKEELGGVTYIYGVFNRVNSRLSAFKEYYENADSLVYSQNRNMKFLKSFISDQPSTFQSGANTVFPYAASSESANKMIENFCEEVYSIILNVREDIE